MLSLRGSRGSNYLYVTRIKYLKENNMPDYYIIYITEYKNYRTNLYRFPSIYCLFKKFSKNKV